MIERIDDNKNIIKNIDSIKIIIIIKIIVIYLHYYFHRILLCIDKFIQEWINKVNWKMILFCKFI